MLKSTLPVILLFAILMGGCSRVGSLTVRSTELDNGNTSCQLRAKNRSFAAVVEELASTLQRTIQIADAIDGTKKISANIKGEDCNTVLAEFAREQKLSMQEASADLLILVPQE